MFQEIIRQIENANRIIIHRHSNPDGDAIGSQIGLKHLILENYPGKEVYAVGDPAGRYAFIEDSTPAEIDDSLYKDALAFVLDTSAKSLISDNRYATAAHTARIDHHIFVETICETEVTDTSYESCCGLVTELAREAGWKVPTVAAKALYTGLVTDSGRFRYDSTTTRTFSLASFLMEQGHIDLNEIYRELYADDFSYIRLRAEFILKIKFTKNNVGYIYTTKEELQKYNADIFAISRGMVGTMSDIRGVDIWVNFTETDKGVLCELRSSKYNINKTAVKYGGGGHLKASGATVPDRETAMKMLQDLDDICGGVQ